MISGREMPARAVDGEVAASGMRAPSDDGAKPDTAERRSATRCNLSSMAIYRTTACVRPAHTLALPDHSEYKYIG